MSSMMIHCFKRCVITILLSLMKQKNVFTFYIALNLSPCLCCKLVASDFKPHTYGMYASSEHRLVGHIDVRSRRCSYEGCRCVQNCIQNMCACVCDFMCAPTFSLVA